MSDNLKRYLAIFEALKQLLPTEPRGNQRRHLCVLAAMISGIAASRRTNLPAIASKMPAGRQRESRIKRLSRWLSNEQVSMEAFFLPFAQALLAGLPEGPVVLVMDGSPVGRGCVALVLSVLYRKKALPLCWIVVNGKKCTVVNLDHNVKGNYHVSSQAVSPQVSGRKYQCCPGYIHKALCISTGVSQHSVDMR
jgi:hypothetical protein